MAHGRFRPVVLCFTYLFNNGRCRDDTYVAGYQRYTSRTGNCTQFSVTDLHHSSRSALARRVDENWTLDRDFRRLYWDNSDLAPGVQALKLDNVLALISSVFGSMATFCINFLGRTDTSVTITCYAIALRSRLALVPALFV